MTALEANARPDLGSTACSEQGIVTLKVGPYGKAFLIHKSILCAQSPYFRAALVKGRWKEGQDNTIVLDETDPAVFSQLVVNWLYTGEVPEDLRDSLDAGYIFADRYDFPELRAQIVEEVYFHYVARKQLLPSYKVIIQAFENLPSTCKLCELYVDLYGSRWYTKLDNEEDAALREQLPASFILPLLERLGEREIGGEGCDHDLSYYSEAYISE
ncbi:hypothetical protein SLS58_010237 [Diplodia intermedia]|uniref:BTB domain-containing protein n=1 Tax=Diplodia intermedia TaxID=856260 RepID=A0ABR3T7F7_9PEZI